MSSIAPYVLCSALLLSYGCGCSESSTRNDAQSDTFDSDSWVADGPCECDDDNPCTTDLCNPDTLVCRWSLLDMDGDGHSPAYAPDGTTFCGGHDCDDTNPDIHPDAPEICLDGIDQDCDTIVDGPKVLGEDIRITATPEHVSTNPRIAWTGNEYVVTWHEFEFGSSRRSALELQRFDLDGNAVDEQVELSALSSAQQKYGLIWTGSNIAMSVCVPPSEADRDSTLHLLEISAVGILEHSLEQVHNHIDSELVWTGTSFGTTVIGNDSSYLFRAFPHDTRPYPDDIAIVPAEDGSFLWGQNIMWTGSRFGLAWHERPDGIEGGYGAVVMATISESLDDSTAPVRLTEINDYDEHDIVWTGSEMGLVLTNGTDVYFARYDAAGLIAGDFINLDSVTAHHPVIAWSGDRYAVSWSTGSYSGSGLMLAVLEEDGTPVGIPVTVVEPGSLIAEHSLAWSESEIGVVWADARFSEEPCEDPYRDERCNTEIFLSLIGFCE